MAYQSRNNGYTFSDLEWQADLDADAASNLDFWTEQEVQSYLDYYNKVRKWAAQDKFQTSLNAKRWREYRNSGASNSYYYNDYYGVDKFGDRGLYERYLRDTLHLDESDPRWELYMSNPNFVIEGVNDPTWKGGIFPGSDNGASYRDRMRAFAQSQQVKSREYWASLAEAARQEAYDSPSQQIARERNAGINADLQAGAVSPGQAAENDLMFGNGASSPSVPGIGAGVGSSDLASSRAWQGSESFGSLVGNALSIVQQFFGLEDQSLSLDGKRTQNFVSQLDMLEDAYIRYYGRLAPDGKTVVSGNVASSMDEVLSAASVSAKSTDHMAALVALAPRRNRAALGRYARRLQWLGDKHPNVGVKMSELRRAFGDNQTRAVRSMADSNFRSGFFEMLDNVSSLEITSQFELQRLESALDKSVLEYNSAVQRFRNSVKDKEFDVEKSRLELDALYRQIEEQELRVREASSAGPSEVLKAIDEIDNPFWRAALKASFSFGLNALQSAYNGFSDRVRAKVGALPRPSQVSETTYVGPDGEYRGSTVRLDRYTQ